jgi:crotonobetainyl-CoA:carnitine CoA-transferase CaiB-like acyl-CoA transferase
MTSPAAPAGALAGIRVIDLTRVLAGPLCTMMLGDMGADIIKIEPPGSGDDTRRWGPPFIANESAYFLGVNRNKRSLTLNLAAEDGRSVLSALLKNADVVIDNFKIGTMEKWGFDDAWYELNAPRVVRCAITGYGSSGPKAALPGYDFILQAESGLMSICGDADGGPTKYGVAIVDVCTGMLACNAVLAGLNARYRTNKGQKVEVSLYETSIAMLANVASSYLVSGKDAGRYGNGHPSIVPYTTYQASDQMIAVAVGNDGQFRKFSEALSQPGWANDPRFAVNSSRVENRQVLDKLVAEVLAGQPAEFWLGTLKAAGIPCGMINTVAQALQDPHTQARAMVETVAHPTAGPVKILGIPLKFSDTPASIRAAPPTLGQHSDEILQNMLGYDAVRIARLRANRTI